MMHDIEDVSGWQGQDDEQLGTKLKAWIRDPAGVRWLFKYPRPNTGEHWAEVVAADIAALVGIPHAHVRLARRAGILGTISREFTVHPSGDAALWHGNYMLATVIVGYERSAQKPPHHTVDAILDLLSHPGFLPPANLASLNWITSASDAFVGYLMLDALIGNTDRHHENWGLIHYTWKDYVVAAPVLHAGGNYLMALTQESWELAPSYDHASSLGRDLDDETRSRRLAATDPRVTVEHYCVRGRTPLFGTRYDAQRGEWVEQKQLTFREAFQRASEIFAQVAAAWLRHLSSFDEDQVLAVVDRVPPDIATDTARAFAKAVLASNRKFLLSLPR